MFSFWGDPRPGDAFVRHRWPTVDYVSQLSFFSAESVPPAVADLTGILAAPGQVVLVGDDKRRLSVVVDRLWRAEGLAEMIDRGRSAAGDRPHRREHPAGAHHGGPAAAGHCPRLDPWGGQDRAAAVAARSPRIEGLDAGVRHPRSRPLLAGPGPARSRHACGAGVGDDAGGDSPDVDRHQRVASGAPDQWATTAIAPGRERRGTPWQRRSV